jgi:hypothetical protein
MTYGFCANKEVFAKLASRCIKQKEWEVRKVLMSCDVLTLLDKGISRETFNEIVVKGFKEHGADVKIEDINLVGWITRDPR